MATTKATKKKKPAGTSERRPIAEVRAENEKLHALLENGARCMMCGVVKDIEKGFYLNTDPMCGGRSHTPICKECARRIALRVDKNGDEHEPTVESVQLALRYLNKPFIQSLWNASIQESENMVAGRIKYNPWTAYVKNVQMGQYLGQTYFESDMFKEKIVYDDEKSDKDLVEEHSGQDTYDSFLKNKADVIRMLDYDPFEKEALSDQPLLYSQLIGLMDSGNDSANDDMLRNASCITIVRAFLQAQKIDDTVSKMMSDPTQIQRNSATIKTLQESKTKLMGTIKDLAAESCISLKNSKNAVKGENTWTGKIRKIKDLNLRDGAVNGFDIATCRGMQQVQEISDASMLKQLALDESEWSDMVAELRKVRTELERDLARYKEINRILLQENLDLKDYLKDKGYADGVPFRDLKELYSVFGGTADELPEEEVSEEVSDSE